ncbi:MAG: thioredoxin family protein [Vicinamibacteria bacterium]|nr:thioredoxin family protein [Vicinamibacteria bacterium]
MKAQTLVRAAALLALSLPAVGTGADPVIGSPAPAFTLPDTAGRTHSLADYKGKWVVLEWVNYDCPFVGKHYNSGSMPALQKEYTGKGVVWLAVNSSAPGKQGNFTSDVIQSRSSRYGAAHSAYLLDPAGTVGRAYGAKTTPHMYVISPAGALVYAGGIDDRPTTDVADIQGAKNHVRAALDEAMAGKPVTTPVATPYGCSVKY